MATTAVGPADGTNGTAWHVLSRDDAVHELHVEPARGLTREEAAERLARYGPNQFAEAKSESRLHAFLRQYEDPMQIVLLVAGIISIYPVKQYGTGVVILLLTLLNAALGLSQEGKAAAAVAALAKMMIVKARVRRDGELALVPAEQLVPGDVVEIEAGDVVLADGRVLAAPTLEVAEAALTGESLPVGKTTDDVEAVDAALGDRTDMVYMNTNVTRGTGEFVVTATGMGTEVGHISGMLQRQDKSKSPLTRQLEKAHQAAGHDRRAGAGRLRRDQHGARPDVHGGVHGRGGVRDRRDPDRAPGRRHDDPLARHAAAGRRQRDRQAAAHPGPDDHRRSRCHRRGDRARARHRGSRDHRRAVRRAQRRGRRPRDRRDRRDRARHAEQKVRLVDMLKRKGHVVGMTGDGVNDAPALKQADIGIAMGITGTEVSKEAAAMILTDDNFATIVKAVELGRGLYDNLVKYIRFQMGVLAGMIMTFLAASILNIASGIPFTPLQTLWVNFTTQVFQSVGLGYGEPSQGLMKRRPRKPDQPLLTRGDTRWFVTAGFVMAVATLGVAAGAEDAEGADLARTMAVTTFAISNLAFSFTARDELRSVFTLDTFADRRLIVTSLMSAAAIVFATELRFFQRILDTVELTGNQWLICIGAGLIVVLASEIRKFLLRRRKVLA